MRLLVICLILVSLLVPIGAQADVDSGTVRVYLKRLVSGYPFEIDMNGSFTAQDGQIWFDTGTHLVAAVREGSIYLYGNGFTLNAGTTVTFIRTSTDEEHYFLLAENKNKYAGDLTLTIDKEQIRPVLTMDIEEYVRGVVPYELGDSFPLETLKAQAVAARTYALSKAGQYSDSDVEDTTFDQVFKGRSSSSPLSEQAVRETAGIIATYNNKPVVCYYTASNGGWIEDAQHIWPRDDPKAYAYMEVKEDPYDVENESSPVRRYVLPKVPADGELNAEISAFLQEAVASALSTSGQTLIADQIRIDGFQSVQPEVPMYANSSILTKVVFTVSVSTCSILETRNTLVPVKAEDTAEPTATPETVTEYVFSEFRKREEPVKITVPFFGTLERAMGLSINSTDNELLTVYAIDSAFVFETRRFGHGSGMSQRGAEQMARGYGKNYEEILAFYYPGATLKKLTYVTEPRQEADSLMSQQPTPRPSPTPRPTLMPVSQDNMEPGWFVAEVTNIDEDSSLNLRVSPSLSAEIRMRLYKYQQLVVESQTSDGWSKVHTDSVGGYVRTEFLQAVQK